MPLPAASPVTVRQLEEMLTTARTSRLRDQDIAQQIGGVEPAERITDATLAGLSHDQGEGTKLALRVLADESAFLDPPAAELPAGGPPAFEEQKAIVERAYNYAQGYMSNLPNFRCTRLIRRFEGNPTLVHGKEAVSPGRLHGRDSIVSDLAFEHGAESQQVRSVNGAPWKKKAPLEGLTTFGEFGAILAAPFGHAKAKWSHWETMDGKRVAVFSYSVDLGHSSASLTWCCTEGWNHQLRETVATQGALSIEPATGAVVRITQQAVGISDGFPMRRSDTAVEYRRVDIGGESWMCPSRSITISDNVKPDQLKAGGTGRIPLHVYELNAVEYADYHKFTAEARLLADDVPPEENKAGEGPAETQAAPAPVADAAAAETALPDTLQIATGQREEEPVAPASVGVPPVAATAPATAPPPPPQPAPAEQPATFQSKVNLVLVPVVVREVNGRAVSDLRKEAFTLFDNGKRREIESFAVERAGQITAVERPAPGANGPSEASHAEKAASAPMVVPDHYVAYLFDDMGFTGFQDLVFVREAALKHIDELLPGDRTAVFTTSCRTMLDFTDDRAKLREALSKTQFKPLASLCRVPMAPPVEGLGGGDGLAAQQGVQYFAANSIGGIVRRMSRLPGQRSIIFISYGLTMNPWAIRELTDLAQRNRVVIHTLNAQGVHPTAAGADVEKDPTKAEFSPTRVWGRLMAWQGMLELARATGGTYLATNDAKAAFRKLATPEWVYMLGITPGEAVVDKKTHAVKAHELKVKLTDPRKLSLQARESYYPPAGAGQQETTARQR